MLTDAEERIAARVAQLLIAELSRRDDLPGRDNGHASIHGAGVRTGVCERDLSLNWRKWGLRRMGRGAQGFEYCGASVAKYRARLNQK